MGKAFEKDGVWLKICPHCEETKTTDGFARNKSSSDGCDYWCRVCRKLPPKNTKRAREENGVWVKECTKCHETKEVSQFGPLKRSYDKLSCYCRRCTVEVTQDGRKRNLERAREREAASARERRKDPVVRERQRESGRRCSKTPKARLRARAYRRHKSETDPVFRMDGNLRRRVVMLVTKQHKKTSTVDIVGCSIDQFRAHLEGLFEPGMSWTNYGNRKDCWSLDHILPCELFDLTQETHQRACFGRANSRPVWHVVNMSKGDTLLDGRKARDLTADEKREYLTQHGYGHLFAESLQAG